MGRTVYWMNVSLDLKIEHAPNENGGGSWMRIGDELHKEFNRRAARLALMIQGRRIYDTMEAFWPAAAEDESQPEIMREYGRIWTAAPKVLVSNTRTKAQHNTRIVGGDNAIEQLAQVRRETEGEIGVGGATLATQLLRHGLLDEMLLFVHPVVLGSGRPLFDELETPLQCDLVEHATCEDGVVMHRYAIRALRPSA